MNDRRWKGCIFAICTIGALVFGSAAAAQRSTSPPPMPQPVQSPNAPTNQNVPAGLDGPQLTPNGPDATNASMNAQNDREIRLGVQRLYALVVELKNQVDQTNSNMVLNAALVKRAQDIEKLAKQIKDRARK